MEKKYNLYLFSFNLLLVILIIIFNIVIYKKSPVNFDVYKKYAEIIKNKMLDDSFNTNVYNEFLPKFKNYKNFYKKRFITVLILNIINLILNVLSVLWSYLSIHRNVKNLTIFFLICLIINFIFGITSIIYVSDESSSHHFINYLAMDMMETIESDKFINESNKCKIYEETNSIFLYFYILVTLFLFVYIMIDYKRRNIRNRISVNQQQQFNESEYLSNENLRQRRIEKCKREIYNPSSSSFSNNNCSICNINFENESDVLILPCNHIFHYACISEFFLRNNFCPIDNAIILN